MFMELHSFFVMGKEKFQALFVQPMYIRPILMTPNLTNMTKITTLQALIESSMPAELKKFNGTRKKFAWKFKFAH